jgi:tetratricopeptide (TPR) repeat protein
MKLADFGIAYAMDQGERAARVGTPWYMAPEQAASVADVGPWSDLYSLGAVGWELVTGAPPHGGDTLSAVIAAAQHGPPPLAPRFPVPSELEGWLRSLLEPDPRLRVQHAADALATLAGVDPTVPELPAGWRSDEVEGPRLRLQGAGLGLVALREPEVAGRVDERRTLWEAMQEARRAGQVRVAVLRGVSGIGKSRLVRWLVERAAELGLADEAVAISGRGLVLARTSDDPVLLRRSLWRHVDTLVIAGHWLQVEPLLLEYLTLPGHGDKPHWGGLARTRLGRAARARHDFEGARRWFEDAERFLDALPPDVEALAARLELYGFWRERTEQMIERAAAIEPLAYEEGRVQLCLFAMSKRVEGLMALDRLAEAGQLARRALDLNRQVGDRRFHQMMQCQLANMAMKAGRYDEVQHVCTDLLRRIDDQRQVRAIATCAHLLRCGAAVALGRTEIADLDLDALEALGSAPPVDREELGSALTELRGKLSELGDEARRARVDRLLAGVRPSGT